MMKAYLSSSLVLCFTASGCLGSPELLSCRPISTTELDLECENNAQPFTGELHFDSEATYDTFLSHQCIPNASAGAIDQQKDLIDFSQDAVFVAVGPSAIDADRCVEERELDSVSVCDSGLKVYFKDTYTDSEFGCPDIRWTVAFSLSRDDLRTALENEAFFD